MSPNWSWEQVAHIHEMILKTEGGTHRESVLFWGFFWATDYKIRLPVDVTSARNLWPFPLTTFLFLFRSSSRSARRQAKTNNTTRTTAAACPATKLCRLSSSLHFCLTQRPGWNDGYGKGGALIEAFQTPATYSQYNLLAARRDLHRVCLRLAASFVFGCLAWGPPRDKLGEFIDLEWDFESSPALGTDSGSAGECSGLFGNV